MFRNISSITIAFCFLLFCQTILAQENLTTYYESKDLIPNPERGMFAYDDDLQGKMIRLDEDDLRRQRIEEGRTVVYRQYSLREFHEKELKTEYLNFLSCDLAIARRAGVKLIIRFAYTDSDEANEPEIEDCKKPNDKDATFSQIKKHLAQLKNFFDSGKDVILMVEAGFIGAYGEWYYTRAEFGMCPSPNYQKRAELLKLILDTVPSSIPVMLRTPFYVENIVKAWKSSGMSADAIAKLQNRLGLHNDCFTADANDMNTFLSNHDRTCAQALTKVIPMVGEGCVAHINKPYAEWAKVEAAGKGYHWSLISSADDGWLWTSGNICSEGTEGKITVCPQNGKCSNGQACKSFSRWTAEQVQTFKQNLGYRIYLSSSRIPAKVKKGEPLSIKLAFLNAGWARPFNNRPIEIFLCPENIVCRDVNKGFVAVKGQNFRDWLPQTEMTDATSFVSTIPTVGLTSGKYDIYLNFPDSMLSEDPAYSVRLANREDGDVNDQSVGNIFRWHEVKGYNRFGRVKIE